MNNEKQNGLLAEDYWRQDGGDKWVEYIDMTEASLSAFNNQLLDAAEIKQGESVLDIGCGGGANSIEIAGRVGDSGHITGADISTQILEVARNRGTGITNLDFIEADAGTDDLGKARYDLVFSRFGVMFFSDPVSAFRNILSAMKPEGRLVFLCWQSLEENPWMGVPAQTAFSIVPPAGPPPAPDAPGPFSFALPERVESILTESGFKNINFSAINVTMKMGSLEQTMEFFLKVGPVAVVLAEASDEQKTQVSRAIGEALKQFETEDGVHAPASAWIVSADKG